MRDFVIIDLLAAMGSFGGPAGVGLRPTGEAPTRSMVLGLIGACLGISRENRAGQESLASLKLTVGVLKESGVLRDFHTAQGVPQTNMPFPQTRRDALNSLKGRDNPTISLRDYRTDCAYRVAIEGADNPSGLIRALTYPAFHVYLGRKSCPLAAPMDPALVQAEDGIEALQARPFPEWLGPLSLIRAISDEPVTRADVQVTIETHRDQPICREA